MPDSFAKMSLDIKKLIYNLILNSGDIFNDNLILKLYSMELLNVFKLSF